MTYTQLLNLFQSVLTASKTQNGTASACTTIKIRDLMNGAIFVAAANKGLFALNNHIVVQPAYQRYYIYGDGVRDVKVIESIINGLPIGMISLYVPGTLAPDGMPMAEILDGQQRVTSIIRYCTQKFSVPIGGNPFNFYALPPDIQNKILDTEIPASICAGTQQMRNEWFKTINMQGVALTNMEILNCVYSGVQVEALKQLFSQATPYISNVASQYIKGDPIRQEIEEAAIKMVNPDVEAYLSANRLNPDASVVNNKFHSVIDWVDNIFPTYYKEMKGLDWGRLYDEYNSKPIISANLGKTVADLMTDPCVTSKKGVFEYALQKESGGTPDPSLLHVRLFDDATKRTVYAQQTQAATAKGESNCPLCAALASGSDKTKIYDIKEMDADHVTAWSKGGSTNISNCTMLCRMHNHMKGNH